MQSLITRNPKHVFVCLDSGHNLAKLRQLDMFVYLDTLQTWVAQCLKHREA